jgi:hypothetical protein
LSDSSGFSGITYLTGSFFFSSTIGSSFSSRLSLFFGASGSFYFDKFYGITSYFSIYFVFLFGIGGDSFLFPELALSSFLFFSITGESKVIVAPCLSEVGPPKEPNLSLFRLFSLGSLGSDGLGSNCSRT